MESAKKPSIVCRLKEIRTGKKFTQAQLADLVGVKRQAIYDMEVGRYLPNTSVALGLARILCCSVEDIFCEQSGRPHPITLVEGQDTCDPRVAIAKIRNEFYGYSLGGEHSIMEEMGAADGLLEPGHRMVNMLFPSEKLENTALLVGCDPAFSILGHHVRRNRRNAGLYCRFASSGKALNLLGAGQAHIAGTHMHDRGSLDGNQEFIRRSMKNFKGLVVAFSFFEEGLMVARKNPLNIQTPDDLAQKKVRFVNREKGAALRSLLEDCLSGSNIPFSAVNGYDDLVKCHSQGAQKILHKTCDAALGLRVVAKAFDLGFVPISRVRCDLVIPQDLLDHTGVKTTLDTLQKKTFRDELNCLPGYDASCTGKIIARF